MTPLYYASTGDIVTKGKLMKEIIRRVYGPERDRMFWHRIDIIGDIAVIRKPFDIDYSVLQPLAEEILRSIPYVKSVWATASPVDGDYRLREFVHLAGEKRSETIYREHGCRFKVDIRKVYITPRLSFEHERIAKTVNEGEIVINMYAGVGLFSIIMAKKKKVKVHSIDINPYAYKYMVINIKLNKVEEKVVPIQGDASIVVPDLLHSLADRILMPLPEKALEHLPFALQGLKRNGGYLHVYVHVVELPGEDPRRKAETMVARRLREIGVEFFKITGSRVVRSVGPRKCQVVIDLIVKPSR